MGRAGWVGGLSVPNGWAAAAPVIRSVAAAMPGTGQGVAAAIAADSQGGLFSDIALSSLAGRAIGGATAHPISTTATRVIGGAVAAGATPTTATIVVIPAIEG
jgi:hypothetical protein